MSYTLYVGKMGMALYASALW